MSISKALRSQSPDDLYAQSLLYPNNLNDLKISYPKIASLILSLPKFAETSFNEVAPRLKELQEAPYSPNNLESITNIWSCFLDGVSKTRSSIEDKIKAIKKDLKKKGMDLSSIGESCEQFSDLETQLAYWGKVQSEALVFTDKNALGLYSSIDLQGLSSKVRQHLLSMSLDNNQASSILSLTKKVMTPCRNIVEKHLSLSSSNLLNEEEKEYVKLLYCVLFKVQFIDKLSLSSRELFSNFLNDLSLITYNSKNKEEVKSSVEFAVRAFLTFPHIPFYTSYFSHEDQKFIERVSFSSSFTLQLMMHHLSSEELNALFQVIVNPGTHFHLIFKYKGLFTRLVQEKELLLHMGNIHPEFASYLSTQEFEILQRLHYHPIFIDFIECVLKLKNPELFDHFQGLVPVLAYYPQMEIEDSLFPLFVKLIEDSPTYCELVSKKREFFPFMPSSLNDLVFQFQNFSSSLPDLIGMISNNQGALVLNKFERVLLGEVSLKELSANEKNTFRYIPNEISQLERISVHLNNPLLRSFVQKAKASSIPLFKWNRYISSKWQSIQGDFLQLLSTFSHLRGPVTKDSEASLEPLYGFLSHFQNAIDKNGSGSRWRVFAKQGAHFKGFTSLQKDFLFFTQSEMEREQRLANEFGELFPNHKKDADLFASFQNICLQMDYDFGLSHLFTALNPEKTWMKDPICKTDTDFVEITSSHIRVFVTQDMAVRNSTTQDVLFGMRMYYVSELKKTGKNWQRQVNLPRILFNLDIPFELPPEIPDTAPNLTSVFDSLKVVSKLHPLLDRQELLDCDVHKFIRQYLGHRISSIPSKDALILLRDLLVVLPELMPLIQSNNADLSILPPSYRDLLIALRAFSHPLLSLSRSSLWHTEDEFASLSQTLVPITHSESMMMMSLNNPFTPEQKELLKNIYAAIFSSFESFNSREKMISSNISFFTKPKLDLISRCEASPYNIFYIPSTIFRQWSTMFNWIVNSNYNVMASLAHFEHRGSTHDHRYVKSAGVDIPVYNFLETSFNERFLSWDLQKLQLTETRSNLSERRLSSSSEKRYEDFLAQCYQSIQPLSKSHKPILDKAFQHFLFTNFFPGDPFEKLSLIFGHAFHLKNVCTTTIKHSNSSISALFSHQIYVFPKTETPSQTIGVLSFAFSRSLEASGQFVNTSIVSPPEWVINDNSSELFKKFPRK